MRRRRFRRATSLTILVLVGLLAACAGGGTQAPTPVGQQIGVTSTQTAVAGTPTAEEAATPTPVQAVETPEATPEPTPVVVGSGERRVTVWHNWAGSYAETITGLIGEWATQNNVTVELLLVPDLTTKVNVAVPAGQGPDIIAWVNDQIGKNAEIEVIQPLDDKGFDRAYLEQNFSSTAVDAMTYSDRIWGVPESMEAIAFVYNKALVSEDELPKTTDELLEKAKAFNESHPGMYYFVYQAAADPYHNAPWWYGFGAYYVQEDGTVGLDTPESIRAGEFLKQLSTIMPQDIDYDVARALFTEGKAAIWMTGPWAIADIEKAGIDYGVAPIPTVSATGQPARPFVGVKCMMLAAGAKNEEAALELMRYYGSAEFQSRMAQANKQVPANLQAQEQVKGDPVIVAFIEQTASGVPLPNTPFMDALWGPAGDAQRAIWTGAQPPDQALKDAAELARQAVEQIKG